MTFEAEVEWVMNTWNMPYEVAVQVAKDQAEWVKHRMPFPTDAVPENRPLGQSTPFPLVED